jgi:hypothetical protein
MNIPGFTAEASLYRRSERKSEHYRMAGAHTHADGAIQPAGSICSRCEDLCGNTEFGVVCIPSWYPRPGWCNCL